VRRFAFRLALALGCTVRELLARLTAAELAEWQAFYRLEPWGDVRADLRAGHIAAMVANVNLRPGAKPLRADEFIFGADQTPPEKPDLTKQMLAVFPIPEEK